MSKTSIEPIVPLLPRLDTYANDGFWELKGQILILCANTLTAFNSIEDEEEETKGPMMLEQKENGETEMINPDDIMKEEEEEGEDFL